MLKFNLSPTHWTTCYIRSIRNEIFLNGIREKMTPWAGEHVFGGFFKIPLIRYLSMLMFRHFAFSWLIHKILRILNYRFRGKEEGEDLEASCSKVGNQSAPPSKCEESSSDNNIFPVYHTDVLLLPKEGNNFFSRI